MPTPVTIPLVNPNEPEALLTALYIEEGQKIASGDLLCTLETTKSAADLCAEADGYVLGLRLSAGQAVRAGDLLCYLAAQADEKLPGAQGMEEESPDSGGREQVPDGLRITEPGLALATQMGVDLSLLPVGPLVTEGLIRSLASNGVCREARFLTPASQFDPTAIVIYGGGGHGKSVLELLRVLGVYRVVGFVDDGIPAGGEILGVPLLGDFTVLGKLHRDGIRLAVNAVGGIGNVNTRVQVFHRLAEAGFACPSIVHPTAFLEPSASLSPGVQVFPHAYVGSESRVGFGAIINTGAIISHDCRLGSFVNISPGAILAGEVIVGDGALIGMGVTVNLQARIGEGARIGNGATVKADVPEGGIVRAGTIWPA